MKTESTPFKLTPYSLENQIEYWKNEWEQSFNANLKLRQENSKFVQKNYLLTKKCEISSEILELTGLNLDRLNENDKSFHDEYIRKVSILIGQMVEINSLLGNLK